MAFFKKRPRWTSPLHFRVARGDAYSTPQTYQEAVVALANAPKDELYAKFDEAVAARKGDWLEVGEAAEAARLDAERARRGVRGRKPGPAPEPEVVSGPRPVHSRGDHQRADDLARLYSQRIVNEQLEARRARLGGEDSVPLGTLMDVARQQAAVEGRFTGPVPDSSPASATAAVVAFIEGGA